ncbi:MAG: hypothetical protein QW756_04760 [Nitrososphaerota archaeon]
MGAKLVPVFLTITLFFLPVVNGEGAGVRDVLRADLAYVTGIVESDGSVSASFDPVRSLRSHALVGSMAALLHLGLGDIESLQLLNRVAAQVNGRVEGEDGVDLGFDVSSSSYAENLITHLTVANFLSLHYGLTKDLRSKANMLKLVQSLERRLGWAPPTSKAAFLTLSSRISFMTGGQPLTPDVSEALREYTQHMDDIINYSAGGYIGLTSSLSQLSQLLGAAHEAGLEPPVELVALWAVHIEYVVNASLSLPKNSDSYQDLLRSLASLVDAAENIHLKQSRYAGEQAISLAKSIAAMWRAGDRILLLPVDAFDVYPLDPLIPGEEIAAVAGRRIMIADLRFPTLLLKLEQVVGKIQELHDVVSLAMSKVSVRGEYFPLVERGVLPSDEFVNRWWRASLLSTYLALQRAPSIQQRSQTIQFFLNSHPTFMGILSILLALALMYRVGLLRW